jgi:hypothetical protein
MCHQVLSIYLTNISQIALFLHIATDAILVVIFYQIIFLQIPFLPNPSSTLPSVPQMELRKFIKRNIILYSSKISTNKKTSKTGGKEKAQSRKTR